MLLLALALVAIVGAAVREADARAADAPRPPTRRGADRASCSPARSSPGILALGNSWWTAEADAYAKTIYQPWHLEPRLDRCTLTIPADVSHLLQDHGHEMHLFLVRTPGFDQLAHLHPSAATAATSCRRCRRCRPVTTSCSPTSSLGGGFPITGIGELDLPARACASAEGDDTTWAGAALGTATTRSSELGDGAHMVWDAPATLRAGQALELHFRIVDRDGKPATDLEPYMGMAAHAEIVRSDLTVFAHVHPDGSVAMPALELARGGMDMANMPGMQPTGPIAPALKFPFGFPQPGRYRIFVQIKRAGRIETGAFDAVVD